MSQDGYYRHPHLHGDRIVFVSEDDLWIKHDTEDIPHRLTTHVSRASHPRFSPDGERIAFTGSEEGPREIYILPAEGGPSRRLTHMGAQSKLLCWGPEGETIYFASNAGQPFARRLDLWRINPGDPEPEQLDYGHARYFSLGPEGKNSVLGRYSQTPAHWKRYRGGRTGEVWIRRDGEEEYTQVLDLEGNITSPVLAGDRLYFLSDHEGVGNVYSTNLSGEHLEKHSSHDTYYARNASTDGERIIYHAGADLYRYDPGEETLEQLDLNFRSSRDQRKKKFVEPEETLQDYSLHPEGHSVAINTRGKVFTMPNWEKAVVQHGEPHGVRYRRPRYLADGNKMIALSDRDGAQNVERIPLEPGTSPEILDVEADFGRPVLLKVSPGGEKVAFSNHRYELWVLDLEEKRAEKVDRSDYNRIAGLDWSPDSNWIAYGISRHRNTTRITLYNVTSGEKTDVTEGDFRDVKPSFDPSGRYLFFLSYREFDPVYDKLHFDLNFPRGMRPYMVTLQEETSSPFVPGARPPGSRPGQTGSGPGEDAEERDANEEEESEREEKDAEEPLEIDTDQMDKRITRVPTGEGIYGRIAATGNQLIYSVYPVRGSRDRNRSFSGPPEAHGILKFYDYTENEKETIVKGITGFRLSRDRSTIIYRAGNRLRVLEAGAPLSKEQKKDSPGRKTGWLDLSRIKVEVDPGQEWEQIFEESWQLQKEHFWDQDMTGVDWEQMRERYRPLLERIGTRSELTDLIKEMQGELGTSHAYVMGGDYPDRPRYNPGFMGADLTYDDDEDLYQIQRIIPGDPWHEEFGSPLLRPGVRVEEGDYLVSVGGQPVSGARHPGDLLKNRAGEEVQIGIRSPGEEEVRSYCVKTLRSERSLRYREWVEEKRNYVHETSGGRFGYVHIPDMGPEGYAEFHRYFQSEMDRDGLVVDVRYNRGGHVSPLILEKLARERLGYDISRWKEPRPFPRDSVRGPLVAVTNEFASSDGDIFSHCFKLMDLGPLVGKRTWGGVIGIHPRYQLVDGGVTTQPEFSFWFEDVRWNVENYGTEPDVTVNISPDEYAEGKDPQLDRALEELEEIADEQEKKRPDFSDRPDTSGPAGDTTE